MGRYLTPGHEYEDGDTISGASMTEHVSEAVLKPTTISEQVLKDPAALTDEVLVNDNGTLKKVTLQQLQTLVRTGFTTIPTGAIMDFAGSDAPEGWLLCYGQEVSRETYAALFTALGSGTIYGAGNGTSSFNVPDLRGRVAAGKDNMGGTGAGRLGDVSVTGTDGVTLGNAGGLYYHTLTVAQLAFHAHVTPQHNHNLTAVFPSFTGTSRGGTGTFSINSETHTTGLSNQDLTTTGAGSSQGHNNVQPTMIVNKIIKT